MEANSHCGIQASFHLHQGEFGRSETIYSPTGSLCSSPEALASPPVKNQDPKPARAISADISVQTLGLPKLVLLSA